ncbi:hypothetical protein [Streptomyces acidiscabies]|uniref:hypothetical protein n=1 Tax=Streptomyces acidiscabies TaxID=42234 RepID=UPI0038F6AD6D
MNRLTQLLGPVEAARWMESRARGLILWHRITPQDATALIEAAVAEHDPAILAEPGQVWTRRTDADPGLSDVLHLTDWLDRDHLAVEDGGPTGTGVIPLLLLHAYELDYWRRPQ